MRMGAWVGLFGPKGMPADLVQKIHAATVAALAAAGSEGPLRETRRRRDAAVARPSSRSMVSDEIAENKELLAEPVATEKK